MRYIALIILAISLTACGTVPKEYNAEEVDCHYIRKGIDYEVTCKIKGNAEVGRPGVLDIVR